MLQYIGRIFTEAGLIIKSIVLYFLQTIEWIKGFLSEPDSNSNKASSTRLMKLIIILYFLNSYGKISHANNQLADIPENWLILLALTLGYKEIGTFFQYLRDKVQIKRDSQSQQLPTQ